MKYAIEADPEIAKMYPELFLKKNKLRIWDFSKLKDGQAFVVPGKIIFIPDEDEVTSVD